MNELIKVTTNSNREQVVSARELHAFLEVESNITTWFKRQVERAMLTENEDFICVPILESEGRGGKNKIDYAISLSSAKELAMLNGGVKGKEARKYFIECEKALNSIPVPSYQIENPIERANRWIEEQKQTLLLVEENKKLQYRSDFVDVCFETDGVFSFEEACKILKLSYGRNTMMKKLRDLKVLTQSNTPMQRFISNGYFKVTETLLDDGKFKKLISTTYATQKGMGFIYKILNN